MKIGVDPARPGSEATGLVIYGGRRSGRQDAMNQLRDEFIKRNPDAVIATFRNGEMRIEKPVKAIERKLLK
jgi:hypothetical protein